MNTTASTDSVKLLERIPHTFIALVARFSIAAVFSNSGQTKVEGLVINFVSGEFRLGWPRLSDSAIALFKDGPSPPRMACPAQRPWERQA